mgnify:FL=1
MEVSLQVFVGVAIVAFAILAILLRKSKLAVGVVALGLVLFSGATWYFTQNFANYDLDAHADQNHYFIGLEVTEDTFEYLKPDFTSEVASYNLDDALVASNVDMIGFDNQYKKYIDFGGLRVTWETTEDVVILSKFRAIKFGLIEATGAEDEKEFKIATTPEELEELQKEAGEHSESGEDTEANVEMGVEVGVGTPSNAE